jgi:hypothetical protein
MANESIYTVLMRTVGFDKSERQVGKMSKALGGLAKRAMLVGGAYFSAQGIIQGARASVDAFARQELAERKLEQALGRTSKALLSQASALQKMSTAGDEAIIEQMAFLGSLDMTEKQISTIIPVALDLASATGMSLESAVRNTAKTFSGLAGELGELVPQLRDLTAEEMKAGKAVEVMAELFGGSAQAETDSLTGSIMQMQNALGDLAENIGSFVSPMIGSLANAITSLISTPMSESLEEDRQSMEELFLVLRSSNATTEHRAKVIEEVNSKYGQYLPNLLNEKSTLDDIKDAHDAVSNSVLAQIAIEVNREKIQKIMQEQFALEDKREKLLVEQEKAQQKYNQAFEDQKKAQEELNATYVEGISVQGKYKDDTAEFEVAMVSGASASDAFGFTLETNRRNLADVTEQLNDTDKAMENNKTTMENLTQQGLDMAKSFTTIKTTTEETGDVPLLFTATQISEAETKYKQLQSVINEHNFQSQLKMTEDVATALSDRMEVELEALKLTEEQKQEIRDFYAEQQLEKQEEYDHRSKQITLDTISSINDAFLDGVNRRARTEKQELRESDKFATASKEERQAMLDAIDEKYANKRKALFIADKATALSEVYINTALAITKAGAQLGAFGIPMSTYLKAQGLAQAGIILAQPMPQYEYGGLVGGNRHAQGGTIIEAEQGEFVMNRDAVENIGVDTLESMNSGAGGGISVVVQGNVMSDSFVTETLPEKIKEAIRRGVDFSGIS